MESPREFLCRECLEPFTAGHICNFDRHHWNQERKKDHRCRCDTCYAAHKAGRAA